MRADYRPTKENIVAVGSVLLLTFGALLIILAVCVYQWRQNNLRYTEFMGREKPLPESFQAVYRKLMADKPEANRAASVIRAGDVRKALARGPNAVGELPPWVAGDGIYISRSDVPVNSGKFLCFVRVNATNIPFGLTSTGECRNAIPGEIFPQDFAPLQSP